MRTRLTAWYVGLLAVVVACLAAFVVSRLNAGLTGAVDRTLSGAAAQIRKSGDVDATAVTAAQLIQSGRVVASRGELAREPLATAPGGPLTRTLGGEEYRIRAVADGGGRLVVVAQTLDNVQDASDRVVTLILVAVPAALLVAALGGWWLAGKAMRPIDAMLVQLGREVEQRERLIADASHELRSPLAAMRAELDVALDAGEPTVEVLESAREEVDRLSRIVDDLLTLARLDAGAVVVSREPSDLHEVAVGVASGLAPLGVPIEVTGGKAMALVDRAHVERALRNVVDNAVKAGGPVTIAVWRRDGLAGLSVTDSGPGVPAGERERIFERFARLDAARGRGGSGLGLAIARELLERSGGTIAVDADGAFVISAAAARSAPDPARRA
jgi:signal transduction histidine kinase